MVDPKLARAYGTLAGFGFIGAALIVLPSTRLLEPTPDAEAYLLTLAALVTGLACMALPWDLLDPRWLHVVGVVATVEVAATVAVFGLPYVALYFLVGLCTAYLAADSRSVALQLGVICLALLGAAVYGPEEPRAALAVALVVIPVLLLTSALFSYLRLKMVHDRMAYHRFAEQTLVLSSQIAGRQLGPSRSQNPLEPVPKLSGVNPPTRLLAAAAAALALPLFAGGLAVAGVRLPEVASAPFEGIGIELPNQEEPAAEPRPARAAAAVAVSRKRSREDDRSAQGPPQRKPEKNRQTKAAGGENPQASPQPQAAPAPAPSAGPSPSGMDQPPADPPGQPGNGQGNPSMGNFLDQASEGFQDFLDQISNGGPPE